LHRNPPYVRQEWIKADKPFLQKHYKAFDGVADLYVYFYELGLNLLKPGGRLGFIVTQQVDEGRYGEALRTLFGEAAGSNRCGLRPREANLPGRGTSSVDPGGAEADEI